MALKKTKYRPLSRTQKIGTTFEIINETLDSAVTELEGLRYAKTPVRLVTTQPLPDFIAVGNELESKVTSLLVVDGVEVEVGDRILVASEYRDEKAPFNGIYDVIHPGAEVSIDGGAKWVLRRSADARLEEDFINGVMVLAVDGQKNRDIFFSLSSESLENLSKWADENPTLSAMGNVALSFSEVTFGGGGIMGTPVVVEELEDFDEDGNSRKRYVLPYSGLHEMIWIDGILQIRGVNYDVEDGYATFKPTMGAMPRKGFNVVTASAALFIASSLKNAGGSFTSPMVVNVLRDASTGRLYAEVPGAGDDELVWLDGILITRGGAYTREGNRIILSNALVGALKDLYDGAAEFSPTGETDTLLFEEEDPFGFELAISGEKLPLLDTNAFRLNGVPGVEYVRKFQQGSISYFDSITNLKKYLPVDAIKPQGYANGMLAAVKEKGIYRFNATSKAAEKTNAETATEEIIQPFANPVSEALLETGRWELIVSYKPVGTSNADKLKGFDGSEYVRKLTKGSIHVVNSGEETPDANEQGAILVRNDSTLGVKVRLQMWDGSSWVDIPNITVSNADNLIVNGNSRSPDVEAGINTVAVRDNQGTLFSTFPSEPSTLKKDTVVSLNDKGKLPSSILTYAGNTQNNAGIVWVDSSTDISPTQKNLLAVGKTLDEDQGKLSAILSSQDIKKLVDSETTAGNKPHASLKLDTTKFHTVQAGNNIGLSVSGNTLTIDNKYSLPGTVLTTASPLDATKLDGTIDADRIPSLPASKITSGTFATTTSERYIFVAPVDIGTDTVSKNLTVKGQITVGSASQQKHLQVNGTGLISSNFTVGGTLNVTTAVNIGTVGSTISRELSVNGKITVTDSTGNYSSITPNVVKSYSCGVWRGSSELKSMATVVRGFNSNPAFGTANSLGFVDWYANWQNLTSRPVGYKSYGLSDISYNTAYTTNGDVAEEVYCYNNDLVSAELSIIDLNYDEGVKKHTGIQYDINVAGVIATAPGVVLGADHGQKKETCATRPVALVGRVPTKVTTKYIDEDGNVVRRPIKRGYILTSSSIPGHAMACDPSDKGGKIPPGTVIGKAMQEWDPPENESQEGVIKVWVNLA